MFYYKKGLAPLEDSTGYTAFNQRPSKVTGIRNYTIAPKLVKKVPLRPLNKRSHKLESRSLLRFTDINIIHNELTNYNKQNTSMFFFKTRRIAFSAETLGKKLIMECRRTRGSTIEYVINEVLNKALKLSDFRRPPFYDDLIDSTKG